MRGLILNTLKFEPLHFATLVSLDSDFGSKLRRNTEIEICQQSQKFAKKHRKNAKLALFLGQTCTVQNVNKVLSFSFTEFLQSNP